MNSKDIRILQEAYMEVVMSEGVVGDGPYGRASTNRGNFYGRAQTNRVNADGNVQKKKKKKPFYYGEQKNIYDIILSHLLDEGYAETPEAAEKIMVNMSEDWREDIVEKFVSPYEGKASYSNPQAHSPATRAMQKSDELQRTEPGSKRQKMQTRRSQQLNRMFQAAKRA